MSKILVNIVNNNSKILNPFIEKIDDIGNIINLPSTFYKTEIENVDEENIMDNIYFIVKNNPYITIDRLILDENNNKLYIFSNKKNLILHSKEKLENFKEKNEIYKLNEYLSVGLFFSTFDKDVELEDIVSFETLTDTIFQFYLDCKNYIKDYNGVQTIRIKKYDYDNEEYYFLIDGVNYKFRLNDEIMQIEKLDDNNDTEIRNTTLENIYNFCNNMTQKNIKEKELFNLINEGCSINCQSYFDNIKYISQTIIINYKDYFNIELYEKNVSVYYREYTRYNCINNYSPLYKKITEYIVNNIEGLYFVIDECPEGIKDELIEKRKAQLNTYSSYLNDHLKSNNFENEELKSTDNIDDEKNKSPKKEKRLFMKKH